MKTTPLAALSLAIILFGPRAVGAAYPEWRHSASFYVLTTPEGADLASGVVVEDFPLLVRLTKEFFDFSQARERGEDIRFSTADGRPLAFQIEEWKPLSEGASLWVRVPRIRGNEQQELRVHWGKADASSASDGKGVFETANGYVAAWHMDPVVDATGALVTRDSGTVDVPGVVGRARRFAPGRGLSGGEPVTTLPSGSAAHTTEAWFRAERANTTIVGWGNEQAQGKVVLQFRSPPHVNVDCYFSDGNTRSRSPLVFDQWVHVAYTYQKGEPRLYVNGVLDSTIAGRSAPLSVRSPARLWIGGWYDHYDFAGDIDEVRLSNVARPPEWVRLEYENQKPLQTVVGPLVHPGLGGSSSVSPERASVREGENVTLSALAPGARKIYWSFVKAGVETMVAVDTLRCSIPVGRVSGDSAAVVRFKAVYETEAVSRDVPIQILEAIPEPRFSLKAPKQWDGRQPIEVAIEMLNADSMRAARVGEPTVVWNVSPLATIREEASSRLVLKRAQNSGLLTIAATLSNGGVPTTQSITINVKEPARDPWVARAPAAEEKPADNQFYARDDSGTGALVHGGRVDEPVDRVFLRVFADGKLYEQVRSKPRADHSYSLRVKLRPGLIRYRAEFGYERGGTETVQHTATNLVCGDAYLINGQSNAVATDWGKEEPSFHSTWIRTFGGMSGNPRGDRTWGEALHRGPDEERWQVGYWAMELARHLVETQHIPICILNGAVGGTRIDQHQRNERNPEDTTTIYGRLLWRARQAGITHGVRGILWHQGENDQGADGPGGGFGWETYRRHFIDLAAAWKQDFPNVQHYYVFQIWPKSCSMGVDGSDNRLREVQRALSSAFSNLSVMSTLGIDPPGGCHFPAAGYTEFARLIAPLLERDFYGKRFSAPITPPNLRRAHWNAAAKDELILEFDQPVAWSNTLADQFYLDGQERRVTGGLARGSALALQLDGPSNARRVTYLDSKSWSQTKLLRGVNGLAALTFCEVPIDDAQP